MKTIVITSGKGGAGKTTVTANLGLKLAKMGYRVGLIDGDIELNNLDVLLGVEDKIVFDLKDAIIGRCRPKQALVESPLSQNLYVLPCVHSLSGVEATAQRIKACICNFDTMFDYLLIDCPAGVDVGFHRAVSLADEALVVVTPDISAVRDADKVLSILKTYKLNSIMLVVNRIRGDLVVDGEMYSPEDISSTLRTEIAGVIPDDDRILKGVLDAPTSADKAVKLLADKVRGKDRGNYDYLKKYTGFFGSIRREIRKRI